MLIDKEFAAWKKHHTARVAPPLVANPPTKAMWIKHLRRSAKRGTSSALRTLVRLGLRKETKS